MTTRGSSINESADSQTMTGDGLVPEKLAQAHDEIVEVVQTASTIDLRAFEGKDTAELLATLQPVALAHVEQALDLARRVFRLSDEWEQKTTPGSFDGANFDMDRDFDFEIDKLVGGADGGASALERVADIAFIAKTELNDRHERVATLSEDSDSWQVIVECDSALRRVRKSLTAVENVLSEADGLPCRLGFQTELEVSLGVRLAYVRFRRSVEASGPPCKDTIFARMRAAGTHIAMMIGREVYPQLRVRDRAQIRAFQERILEWLRDEDRDDKAGIRIWQDLVGAIDIFCQVSRRQEVVEHDAAIVAHAYADIFETPGGQVELSPQVLAQLRALEGLDPELDNILASERRHSAAMWKTALERLRVHFGLAQPTAGIEALALEDGDFF